MTDLAEVSGEGGTPRTDALWAEAVKNNGMDCSRPEAIIVAELGQLCRTLERELAAMTKQRDKHMAAVAAYNEDCKAAEAELAAMRWEYICKCGIRVTPHRCQTGSDF